MTDIPTPMTNKVSPATPAQSAPEQWLQQYSADRDPADTPARRKFQLHSEVRLSESAVQQQLDGGRPWRAWVTSFPRDGNKVKIHRKGIKIDQVWHIDLLEPIESEGRPTNDEN